METHTLIDNGILKQHLIDPEICIRCNTCEATCPVNAITHDDNNYVVRADVCNGCMACISPCPTGSIDNWRKVLVSRPYTVQEQLGWESLPTELPDDVLAAAQSTAGSGDVQDLSQAQAVIAAAESQIGKPYDWLGVLGIGLHRDWQEPDRWFCSEMAAWAFQQAGRPLFRPDALYRITPQHFWMLPYEARLIETPDALQPA